MSFQSVTVQGRIAKDPEIKQSGETTIARFSIPVNYKKKGEDQTEWFNCTAFNKNAELIQNFFPRGKAIIVQGRFETQEYEGKKYTNLIVNDIKFVDNDAKDLQGNDEEVEERSPAPRQARQATRPAARTAAPAQRRAAATDSEDLPWEQ